MEGEKNQWQENWLVQMILISHRGNIDGKKPHLENNPSYIDDAIDLGYDVEIDLWMIDGRTYLGHDEPQYEVDDAWLTERVDKLWVHCKNIELLKMISLLKKNIYLKNLFE